MLQTYSIRPEPWRYSLAPHRAVAWFAQGGDARRGYSVSGHFVLNALKGRVDLLRKLAS